MRFEFEKNSLREFVREQQNKTYILSVLDLIEEEKSEEDSDEN